MRVAMLISAPLPPCEGMGFYAWNLSRHLTGLGHSVHIITRGPAHLQTCEVVDGIRIWRPPFWPLYPYHVHYHSLFVDRLVRRLEPELDLLHLHSPLVRHPHTRLPSLVTVHSLMRMADGAVRADSVVGLLAKLQAQVSVRLERQVLARAGRVAVVSGATRQELSVCHPGVAPADVLGNGVDTHRFRPARTEKEAPGTVLTAGRLAPGKGLDDLLACAALVAGRCPAVRFAVAGAGPLARPLSRRVNQLGLEHRVVLLGHVGDRARMAALYRGAALYLHPSHYEGLPTALLEAMACGRPVVATAVGGAPDAIHDGRNGLLVSPGDPAAMAEAVLRLLADPALRIRLGAAARETVARRFSWQVIGRHHLAVYEALLG
jgi:glycosyltransferase involved in cell wall biosynthesis